MAEKKKVRISAWMSEEVVEGLKDAAYWTRVKNFPAALEKAAKMWIDAMTREHNKGKPFPKRPTE
jgi:hypothetical protein